MGLCASAKTMDPSVIAEEDQEAESAVVNEKEKSIHTKNPSLLCTISVADQDLALQPMENIYPETIENMLITDDTQLQPIIPSTHGRTASFLPTVTIANSTEDKAKQEISKEVTEKEKSVGAVKKMAHEDTLTNIVSDSDTTVDQNTLATTKDNNAVEETETPVDAVAGVAAACFQEKAHEDTLTNIVSDSDATVDQNTLATTKDNNAVEETETPVDAVAGVAAACFQEKALEETTTGTNVSDSAATPIPTKSSAIETPTTTAATTTTTNTTTTTPTTPTTDIKAQMTPASFSPGLMVLDIEEEDKMEEEGGGDIVGELPSSDAKFFATMKKEKAVKDKADKEEEDGKLAAMPEEEREAYLAKKTNEAKHEAEKKKMLKKQFKRFSAVGPSLKGKGTKGKGKRKKKGKKKGLSGAKK